MTLQEIGTKHGTDKATTHFYMDNYERHFQKWRHSPLLSILEIGVGNGSSIKTWREYFPYAKVWGLDNNPDCAGDGIFIGSQNEIGVLDWVLSQTGVPDIIIDDGSHVGDDMVTSFKYMFPLLKSNSFYCLEDTHTLYSTHYSGEFESNGRTRGYNFFADLPYHVDVAGRAMCGNPEVAINWGNTEPPVPEYSRILKAIHHYPSLWIYERR